MLNKQNEDQTFMKNVTPQTKDTERRRYLCYGNKINVSSLLLLLWLAHCDWWIWRYFGGLSLRFSYVIEMEVIVEKENPVKFHDFTIFLFLYFGGRSFKYLLKRVFHKENYETLRFRSASVDKNPNESKMYYF